MNPRNPHKIDHSEIPASLVELLKVVHTQLPDAHRALLAEKLDKVIEDTARRRRILGLVQESLAQLRLDISYLMFDLEATKRERDEALEKLN